MKTLPLIASLSFVLASTSAFADTHDLPVGRDMLSCTNDPGVFHDIADFCRGVGPLTLGAVPTGDVHPELVGAGIDIDVQVNGTLVKAQDVVTLRVGSEELPLHDGVNPHFRWTAVATAAPLNVSVSTLLDGSPQALEHGARADIQSIVVRVTPTEATLLTWRGDAKDAADLLRARMEAYDYAKLMRDMAAFTGESSEALRRVVEARIATLVASGRSGTELVTLRTILANIDATIAGDPAPVVGSLDENVRARRADVVAAVTVGTQRSRVLETWRTLLSADLEAVRAELDALLTKAGALA